MTDDVSTIADLHLDPRNPRRRGQRAETMLQSSLQEVGVARSIVIDEDNNVLAGNGTVEAAGQVGIERVTVVEADGETLIAVRRRGLTEVQKRRLSILDNRTGELAEWDADVLVALQEDGLKIGDLWIDAELEALLAPVQSPQGGLLPDADTDAIPESAPTRCKAGDLWRLGEHRVLCGDSTKREDVERLMGGERADIVWTDPPYGVAIGDKNKYLNSIAPSNRIEENLTNDTLDETALLSMLRSFVACAVDHAEPGGAWYVAAPPGPLHLLFGQALNEHGIWHQTIQWVKNNATFAPLGVDYHWRAEPIFYGWLPGAAHRYYGGRQQDTVWEIDRPVASSEHPTIKPVELVARAVQNSSVAGQIVMDPFLGSGTTLIAAEQLGRRCYGMEIEPRYCDVILSRWEQATGRTAELIEYAPSR